MSGCTECDRGAGVDFTCSTCRRPYCYHHRHPNDHDCPGSNAVRRFNISRSLTAIRNRVEVSIAYSIYIGPILAAVLCLLFIAGLIGTGIPVVDQTASQGADGLKWLVTPESTEVEREAELEKAIHQEINEVRRGEGRSVLKYNKRLSAVAKNHSQDMASRNYYNHTNPEGETAHQRVSQAGVGCEAVGENLLLKDGAGSPEKTAEIVVRRWMNSKGHRENLLRKGWYYHGVGVEIDNSEVYVTELFCG